MHLYWKLIRIIQAKTSYFNQLLATVFAVQKCGAKRKKKRVSQSDVSGNEESNYVSI